MACTSWLAWFLLGLCLSRPALVDEPTPIPRATTQEVHQTVDRAIGYLQTESAAWLNTRKCAACHHVPMPLWALSEAERLLPFPLRKSESEGFYWQWCFQAGTTHYPGQAHARSIEAI
jgi:hypothetical protein